MLVETLIAQICSQLVRVDYAACTAALTATSHQTSIARHAETFEEKSSQLVYERAESVVGREVLIIGGVTYKVTRDKMITYAIKREPSGFVPSITTSLGVHGGEIKLGWRF